MYSYSYLRTSGKIYKNCFLVKDDCNGNDNEKLGEKRNGMKAIN